jgi:hypothetical protein
MAVVAPPAYVITRTSRSGNGADLPMELLP